MKKGFFTRLCTITLAVFAVLTFDDRKISDYSGKVYAEKETVKYSPPATPETMEQEASEVLARVNELLQALSIRDIDKIVELCNDQEGYREKFEENKDNFPQMAETLKTARLTHLADGYDGYNERVGQITVDVGSKSYALPIVKINGKWFFQDL